MPERPHRAAILAAGEGTRMWPLTATRPKPALPVAGTPLVARLVHQAARAGADDVTVVAAEADGPVAGAARRAAKDAGVEFEVAVQREQRGTGHALQAAGLTGEATLVLYGDLYLPEGALPAFVDAVDGAGVGARRVDDVGAYGALTVDDGRLTGIEEKPDTGGPGLANAGVYVLPAGFEDALAGIRESPRGELELTDALAAHLDETAYAVHAFEAWQDVGWPWDLVAANADALGELEPAVEGTVHEDATVRGPVRVEAGATVREGSVVEGPALVQAGATVGPNAYVRPGTTLGPDAKVGHACEVKNSLLLEGAAVPHVSYVGDSALGANVNLGAGTQVANLRHDEATIQATTRRGTVDTGRRKFGVALGEAAKTGINATLNAGVMLGPQATVKPGETVWESRVDG